MATWKTPNTSHTVEDQVTPDIFNTLAENEIYLKDTKIVSSQVQDGAVTSTESTTRANIASGDTVKVAFGKLRKWFSDFGVLCFLDKVDTDQIEPTSVTMGKIASNAVSTGKLDGLAVTTAKIANAAVTDVKLAANSVITEKILDLLSFFQVKYLRYRQRVRYFELTRLRGAYILLHRNCPHFRHLAYLSSWSLPLLRCRRL